MSESFIKYIANDKAKWLREKHTALYLLLSLAVERVRWENTPCPKGLLQGDALLGSYKEAGISRQQYRDAIDKGIKFGIWKIVYNKSAKGERKFEQQKRTTDGTIGCIVVNITNPMCWDLNLKARNQPKNLRGTSGEPVGNHILEDKEDKEDKEVILFVGDASNEKKSSSPKVISFKDVENPYMDLSDSKTSEENNITYTSGPSVQVPTQQKKNIKTFSPEIEGLHAFFLSSIQSKKPNFKQPKKETWCKEIEGALKEDNRSVEELKKTFFWALNHNFWYDKMLKPKGLRNNFDQIEIQMGGNEKSKKHSTNIPKPTGESKYKPRLAIPRPIEGNT
jgi:hypothetical protein